MQFSLRTLIVATLLAPPALAGLWWALKYPIALPLLAWLVGMAITLFFSGLRKEPSHRMEPLRDSKRSSAE